MLMGEVGKGNEKPLGEIRGILAQSIMNLLVSYFQNRNFLIFSHVFREISIGTADKLKLDGCRRGNISLEI